MASSVLSLYRRITRWPAGHWLFSRAGLSQAPYFATIAPRFVALEPGRCEVRIRDRRRVHNHIGTVHAIALCNLAELSAGVMTDATIPARHALDSQGHDRGIPEEGGRARCMRVATPDAAGGESARPATNGRWPCAVTTAAGEVVFEAHREDVGVAAQHAALIARPAAVLRQWRARGRSGSCRHPWPGTAHGRRPGSSASSHLHRRRATGRCRWLALTRADEVAVATHAAA